MAVARAETMPGPVAAVRPMPAAPAIRRQSNFKTKPISAEPMPATAASLPSEPVDQLVMVVTAAVKVVSVPAIAELKKVMSKTTAARAKRRSKRVWISRRRSRHFGVEIAGWCMEVSFQK